MKPKTALEIIKERRLELKLTQKQLAQKAGVFNSIICRIEGGYGVPNAETLRKLAKPLGLDAKMLIRLAEEERKEKCIRRNVHCGYQPK